MKKSITKKSKHALRLNNVSRAQHEFLVTMRRVTILIVRQKLRATAMSWLVMRLDS